MGVVLGGHRVPMWGDLGWVGGILILWVNLWGWVLI